MLTANNLSMQQQHVLLEDATWVAMQAAYVAAGMTYAMPYDAVTANKVRRARELLSEAWDEVRLAREQEMERQRALPLEATIDAPLHEKRGGGA